MADINDQSKDVSLHDETTNNPITTTVDDSKLRLDVDAKISDIDSDALLARYDQPVSEGEFGNDDRNKVKYTVPTGKILYITTLSLAWGTDGGELYAEWQEDGSTFHAQAVSQDGNRYNTTVFPPANPLGGFSAGTVIRCRRETGDVGKDWSASFTGYLEDV